MWFHPEANPTQLSGCVLVLGRQPHTQLPTPGPYGAGTSAQWQQWAHKIRKEIMGSFSYGFRQDDPLGLKNLNTNYNSNFYVTYNLLNYFMASP